METNTSQDVLYEALEQAVRPLTDSITKEFDSLYNIKDEKRSGRKDYDLSDLLDWASTVAFEVEFKRRRKVYDAE